MAQVCPVVGSSNNVLPPSHPKLSSDPEARCPVTNAKVSHHNDTIHNHPASSSIPADAQQAMDATQCPVASKTGGDTIDNATCPVVGQVSGVLPPSHPSLTEQEAGVVCPVTNARLDHHAGKVHLHPAVPKDSPAQNCPVAGSQFK